MIDSPEVEISTLTGKTLNVSLTPDGERAHSCLIIDGLRYHFERIKRSELLAQYKIDSDPDYMPQMDMTGHCYILAPYSE